MSEDHSPVGRMKKIDEILSLYEQSLGLPPNYPESAYADLQSYLNMQKDELEKLDPQDAAQISYRLTSFALHINRAYNTELSRYNWATSYLHEVAAKEIDSYEGYKYEERLNKVVNGNDFARKLNEIVRYTKQRADRLSFLSKSIKDLADAVKNIQRAKEFATQGERHG